LPAKYDDLIFVGNKTANVVLDALAQLLGDAWRAIDDLDDKIGKLERENAELRGEVADLTHSVEHDRATRGVGDVASLPASLVRKNRAAAKASR
jgi:hypothetical protein